MDERNQFVRNLVQAAVSNRLVTRPKDGLMPTLFISVKGEGTRLYGLTGLDSGTISDSVSYIMRTEKLSGSQIEQVSIITEVWMRHATDEEMEENEITGPRPSELKEAEAIAAITVWPDGPAVSGLLPIKTRGKHFRADWKNYTDSSELVGPLADALRMW